MKSMKKGIALWTFLALSTMAWSQNQQSTVKKQQLEANLLVTPNLEYELGISDKSTLGLRLGTELLFVENQLTEETKFSGLYPNLGTYFRHYYNLGTRNDKGKKTSNNAANYIGANASYTFSTPIFETDYVSDEDYFITTSAVWGIQRTFWKDISFNLELGLAYSFSDLNESFYPLIGLQLGYVFL